MVLNPDCVRDVLLAVESCKFNGTTNIEKLSAKLTEYTEEELWYTCLKLDEGKLLDVETIQMTGSVMPGVKRINCLTYHGHEFLSSVRDPKHWRNAKGICKGAGVVTLEALKAAANAVATAAVTAALQLYT